MALVSIIDLQEMMKRVERLTAILEAGGVDSSETGEYVEPGPNSPRMYFAVPELAERWGWGETKVRGITAIELPKFKRGQLIRYFWAHVWAYEGRISREAAKEIFECHHALQEAAQSDLPHTAQPARIRHLS
jgi:hypothetical protein